MRRVRSTPNDDEPFESGQPRQHQEESTGEYRKALTRVPILTLVSRGARFALRMDPLVSLAQGVQRPSGLTVCAPRQRSVEGGCAHYPSDRLTMPSSGHRPAAPARRSPFSGAWRSEPFAGSMPAQLPSPIVVPPSTTRLCPVMKPPARLASNTATPAISSGSPTRRSGVRESRRSM